YGAPLSQGSATLWHGAIGLPTSLPGRGYGRTDAVRRAASAAWSRATFFVLAFPATSKKTPPPGGAPPPPPPGRCGPPYGGPPPGARPGAWPHRGYTWTVAPPPHRPPQE